MKVECRYIRTGPDVLDARREVYLDGRLLPPPEPAARKFAPDYAWGFGGNRDTQLAYAILKHTPWPEAAERFCYALVWYHIYHWRWNSDVEAELDLAAFVMERAVVEANDLVRVTCDRCPGVIDTSRQRPVTRCASCSRLYCRCGHRIVFAPAGCPACLTGGDQFTPGHKGCSVWHIPDDVRDRVTSGELTAHACNDAGRWVLIEMEPVCE